MPRYSYAAYNGLGKLEKGEFQAADELAVLSALAGQGLQPVSIEEGALKLPWWQRDISFGSGDPKASPVALEHFFQTLSGLLEVHLPLRQALRFCAENVKDKHMAQTVSRLEQDVADGKTLALAMRETKGYFPDRLITMIEIGEAANNLRSVTARIAAGLESEAKQRREIRSAMIYPVILILMSLFVTALLVFYLAPTLVPVFDNAESDPPFILGAMTKLRDLLVDKWLVTLVLCVVVFVFWQVVKARIKTACSPLLLKLPVIGRYLRISETLKILDAITMMLSSGSTLPRAVETARQATGQDTYRDLLAQSEERIVAGDTLSSTFGSTSLIDPMTVAMIEAAEASDQMVQVLDRLVTDLRMRSAQIRAQSVRLITPILTLAIGLGVGGVIMSTISAIMSLNDVAF
ncbi:type II secretion system F family protein [Ruegeria sp.]|uniref:type II secretion system F family protein n=1 Tax=Ruegeria sp. TaxID=1879320 RepID=UPI00232454C4|nr:type II secretion system F family protein [Ruegeria sp.]MDA7966150.1 type II secretion system F family protein [Ruegeria sp.]